MSVYQLMVAARSGREVPVRIAGLLLPLDIEIVGLHFTRPPHSQTWHIELTVRTSSADRLDFLTKRLHRLIDVTDVRVAALGDGNQGAQRSPASGTADAATLAYAN